MAKTVLIVDDEEDVRTILKLAMEKEGFAVQTAEDGQEARDHIDRRRPDLVLLDLRMPNRNGYQLFAELKSDEKTKAIPIVVVTALTQGSDKVDAEWARRMGAQGFLTKPFDLEELGDKVREIVRTLNAER